MISSHLSPRDAAREVWLDLKSRPGRSALTALGTLIGIAVLVSTIGLAASVSARIGVRFDALTATEVTVNSVENPASRSVPGKIASSIPWDAPQRAMRVDGTVAAATITPFENIPVTGTPITDPRSSSNETMAVYAVSPDAATVLHADISGRSIDAWHDARATPVALLGQGAAERLRIADVSNQPVIFIKGQPVVVIGIINSVERRTEVNQGIVVTNGYAKEKLGLDNPKTLIAETRVGAAEIVADQIPLAIRPDHPDSLTAAVPPSPELTRNQISGDTQTLLLVLAGISLVIGGVGIANMTLVAVLERVPEIGLRRAIGARRRHIVTQFLMGSVVVGFVGGMAGTSIGQIVTVVVSLAQSWPPTLPWIWLVISPLLGALIGLLAGIYPAYRASRIEPIEALRAS